jgi:hypothetical protein
MHRRIIRRGLSVLALAAVLAFAGVRPAAAQETGIFERGLRWLASLWGAPTEVRSEDSSLSSFWSTEQVDKGLGVDPNGGATSNGNGGPWQPPVGRP